MSLEEKKSYKKYIALTVSTILHLAGIYYLGKIAVDLALPEGTVDSIEMDYSNPQGQQLETTQIDVVNTPEIKTQTPPPMPKPAPAPIVRDTLPKKEVPAQEVTEETPTQEISPVVVPSVNEEPPSDSLMPPSQDPLSPPLATPPVAETTPSPELAADAQPTQELAPPTQETPPAPEQIALPFGSSQGVQSDKVLTPLPGNQPISYPTIARLRRVEGTTIIHYKVSPDGNVIDAKIAQSSGSGLLDNSALESIRSWKFKPTGVEGVYERPIRFKLAGEAQEAPGQLRRLPSQ